MEWACNWIVEGEFESTGMEDHSHRLAERMMRGDRSCYEEIVALYADDVYRLCYVLLWNREEAQDVLQEALLRLVRLVQQGRFRTADGSIRGFLMTAAKNLCLNRLRSRVNFYELEAVEPVSVEAADTMTPDRVADAARFAAEFDNALGRLPALQRAAWVLFAMNGESYADIAKALNVSVSNVRISLHRARRKMRLFLEQYEDLR